MKQKYYILPQFFVACLILLVSIYKASSVQYAFSQAPSPTPSSQKSLNINYPLPDPEITPESPLWPVHALIDKADNTPQAYLENADIRLVSGHEMVEKGKVEEGYVVLEKSANYLGQSYKTALGIEEPLERYIFIERLSLASLKHREILEGVLATAPDDGRAVITRIMDTSKEVYEMSSEELQKAGLTVPSYPF